MFVFCYFRQATGEYDSQADRLPSRHHHSRFARDETAIYFDHSMCNQFFLTIAGEGVTVKPEVFVHNSIVMNNRFVNTECCDRIVL